MGECERFEGRREGHSGQRVQHQQKPRDLKTSVWRVWRPEVILKLFNSQHGRLGSSWAAVHPRSPLPHPPPARRESLFASEHGSASVLEPLYTRILVYGCVSWLTVLVLA